MIENSSPPTWKDLQEQVNKILNEIGFESEVGKKIFTPRGVVEIDILAIDTKSIDKIKYIIECKNWATTIPQTVVHAFTTVMHESGGNIGYIISNKGLQSGAIEYTKHTNIHGLTYLEFQEKYFEVWFENYFAPNIGAKADALIQYTEIFNSRRAKYLDKLSDIGYLEYNKLCDRYAMFGLSMCLISAPPIFQKDGKKTPSNIEEFKKKISDSDNNIHLKAHYFRDLLSELYSLIDRATEEFNDVFNDNIFAHPDY